MHTPTTQVLCVCSHIYGKGSAIAAIRLFICFALLGLPTLCAATQKHIMSWGLGQPSWLYSCSRMLRIGAETPGSQGIVIAGTGGLSEDTIGVGGKWEESVRLGRTRTKV